MREQFILYYLFIVNIHSANIYTEYIGRWKDVLTIIILCKMSQVYKLKFNFKIDLINFNIIRKLFNIYRIITLM